MTPTPKDRELFEDLIFQRYFLSHVTRELKLREPDTMKNKDELCARDGKGNYTDRDVSAMWFGFTLAIEYRK